MNVHNWFRQERGCQESKQIFLHLTISLSVWAFPEFSVSLVCLIYTVYMENICGFSALASFPNVCSNSIRDILEPCLEAFPINERLIFDPFRSNFVEAFEFLTWLLSIYMVPKCESMLWILLCIRHDVFSKGKLPSPPFIMCLSSVFSYILTAGQSDTA